jgi:hypothetical protein
VSAPPPDPRAEADFETGVALRRSAYRGFAAGGLVAAAVFGFFALLPGTTRPLGLYLGLAVVLGVTGGLLATIVLVGWQAHALARDD